MRLLRYAFGNIGRSLVLSISSITVIGLMAFLIFVLFLVEYVTQSLTHSVSSRLSLSLIVKTGMTSTSKEIIDTLGDFRKIDPSIQATFSSAQENLENMKKMDPDLAKIVENDSENPLPGTISVKNVPIEQYQALDAAVLNHGNALEIDEEGHKKSVIGYKYQYDRLRSVVEVLHSLRYGLYGIIGFFLFSVFIVIFHSIGNAVFFFREEIKITQLVGGQKRYIYGPFVLQGMIYSIAALIISGSCFYFGLKAVRLETFSEMADSWGMSLWNFYAQSLPLFLFVGLSVILLGWVSGLVSSWRFVK